MSVPVTHSCGLSPAGGLLFWDQDLGFPSPPPDVNQHILPLAGWLEGRTEFSAIFLDSAKPCTQMPADSVPSNIHPSLNLRMCPYL